VPIFECFYHKLVETFHVVCECKTAVYFSWCWIHTLAQLVQLFWQLVTFGVASSDSLTDSELQLLIETEQDWTRHSFIQYFCLKILNNLFRRSNDLPFTLTKSLSWPRFDGKPWKKKKLKPSSKEVESTSRTESGKWSYRNDVTIQLY